MSNTRIIEEASEWLVEFAADQPDSTMRQNFDAWLRQSPEHVRTYLELLPLWKQGALAQFKNDQGPEALIAYARREDNVVPWVRETGLSAAMQAQPSRLTFRGPAAIAAALVTVLLGSGLLWHAVRTADIYRTGVGEQHSVVLADGSTLEINALSKVRTRFTDERRSVDLVEGQALFKVAKDPARPFIVNVDGTHIRAVGTQFDVYRKKTKTVVTVIEGRVAVSTGGQPALISAGEQLAVTAEAKPIRARPQRINSANVTAWTQRRLVFEDSVLAEVVEEFNRYNLRPLVIEDGALNDFPVSAAFSSTDPASLIRFLQAQPGVQVTVTERDIRISSRR